MRKPHIVFHRGYTSLCSQQQCTRVLFYPHPCQHSSFLFFLMIAIMTDVKWCLIVVLVCTFLVISDGEHLLWACLAICLSSLEKWLFTSSARFKIWLSFSMLSSRSSFFILSTHALLNISFAGFFSHSVDGLFILLVIFYIVQRFFHLRYLFSFFLSFLLLFPLPEEI